MFEDIIEILLKKKETLREELEREYAARSEKIDGLLELAGYTPPDEDDDELDDEAELYEDEIELEEVPASVPVPEAAPAPTVGMTVY